MSSFQTPGFRKESIKASGKLVSFFVQPAPRSTSENISAAKKSFGPSQNQISDLVSQGKALNIAAKKIQPGGPAVKNDLSKPSTGEGDERYQYFMKRGIIKRVEKDDKIIFAELPGLAGVLVVYRSPSERNANPERLNLDRRDLTQMPLLEGEERLRLLNYQHNQITKIENLLSLPNLIFLDLYNNQIKEINGLQTVPGLRVLMLGKNLIEKIRNLNSLGKLDVLDLHSNKITKIENLGNLIELRVLNLANNQICVLEGLENLKALAEINLRRNLVEVVRGVQNLNKLQRLFLSNNKLETLENIETLAQCSALTELALDSNPIQAIFNYTASVLGVCKSLTLLDQKKVTPEMKENLIKTPKAVQDSSTEGLIQGIELEWRNEIERLKTKGLNFFRRRKENIGECLVQSGHAEIEGESLLFIYGNALEVIANQEFHESVLALHMQYIRFDYIVQNSSLVKLKKFVNLKKIHLQENNLHSYIQLSKLESVSSLVSLNIMKNDVIFTTLFRSFIVYRFPNLTEINNQNVSDEDRTRAKQQYENFDKILSNPSIFKISLEGEKENLKSNRLSSKKNSEVAGEYVKKIISISLQNSYKISNLFEYWESYTKGLTKKTIKELINQRSIKEESLYL